MKTLQAVVALALAFLATSPVCHAAASAVQITDVAQLVPGQNAQGQVGDCLLSNDYVRVVIDDIAHPHGFATTGGNVIDAATPTGEDRFASMFAMFDRRYGRHGKYSTLSIVNAGGGSNTAQVRVVGVDSEVPSLAVVTDYSLGPNDRFVTVVTTLTNNGSEAILTLPVGDSLQWGLTTHFVPSWSNANRNIPGDGFDIGGIGWSSPWVAANGSGSSYGYTLDFPANVASAHGATWSDMTVAYLDLPAGGGTGSYTRYFMIGDGSISSISDIAFQKRATVKGTLSGTITESGTGLPISGATVVVTRTQCLGTSLSMSYTIGRTSASGSYSAFLEPGTTYAVVVQATGRTSSACFFPITISSGSTTTQNATLSRQGLLRWDVTDGALPIPAKISVLYDPLTTKLEGPELGDPHTLVGGYSILSETGSGSAPVPPGNYRVWVSRGIEYETDQRSITITGGNTTYIQAVLTRVVESQGYVSADTHFHTLNSPDSGITAQDRARQGACEGLELLADTDHDYITEGTPLGLWLGRFAGDEVTTSHWGHFDGFPLTPDSGASRNGALDHSGLTPSQIFAALRSDLRTPALQLNHPRRHGAGYFALTNLNPVTGLSSDPDFSWDFDAVEVFDGKQPDPRALDDWYNILNNGKKRTGVGNSDTHQVFLQEIGFPRNFLRVETDEPSLVSDAALTSAVKSGAATFTNGPFVELWVDGLPMGEQVTNTTGNLALTVRVQAPTWITVDTLNLIVNGTAVESLAVPETGFAVRLDQSYPLTITRDSWIAAEVTGGECATNSIDQTCLVAGCPGRMDPVISPQYGYQPVCPYAHTNPVYVDVDGNGLFDGPGNIGLLVEPISGTRTTDANLDYLRKNTIVTVRGTVTVASSTFDHASNLVYFQDSSLDLVNQRSGGTTIYQEGLIRPTLSPGDRIQVTGTVSNYNGILEMTDVAIEKTAAGSVPDPLVLTVADLIGTTGAGEKYEGMLVRINTITSMTGTWPTLGNNGTLNIKDASSSSTLQLRIDSDTDCDGSTKPVAPFDVIGVLGQYDTTAPYNTGFQLNPRMRADIVESATPLAILHDPAANAVTSCSATILWYTNKTGTSVVEYGTTPSYGSVTSGASGVSAHSVVLSALLPNTTYHYRVTTGSVTSGDHVFATGLGPVPALVSGPSVGIASTSSVQIFWTTDIPSGSEVSYGPNPSYGSSATGASGVTAHYVTISGLQAGATYHYRIVSASGDCGGGTYQGSDRTFVIPVPGINPEVSGGGSPVPLTMSESGTGVVFRFEYRGPAVQYHIYGAGSQAAIDSGLYAVKICDLIDNSQGVWATDGSTWVTWTLTEGTLLPVDDYVVVAESGGIEGSYGRRSDGSYRGRDVDHSAPTTFGCVAP